MFLLRFPEGFGSKWPIVLFELFIWNFPFQLKLPGPEWRGKSKASFLRKEAVARGGGCPAHTALHAVSSTKPPCFQPEPGGPRPDA